jgi:hypothetical protein
MKAITHFAMTAVNDHQSLKHPQTTLQAGVVEQRQAAALVLYC